MKENEGLNASSRVVFNVTAGRWIKTKHQSLLWNGCLIRGYRASFKCRIELFPSDPEWGIQVSVCLFKQTSLDVKLLSLYLSQEFVPDFNHAHVAASFQRARFDIQHSSSLRGRADIKSFEMQCERHIPSCWLATCRCLQLSTWQVKMKYLANGHTHTHTHTLVSVCALQGHAVGMLSSSHKSSSSSCLFFPSALISVRHGSAITHIYFSQTLFNSLPLAIQNFTAVRYLCPTERKEVDTCRERAWEKKIDWLAGHM